MDAGDLRRYRAHYDVTVMSRLNQLKRRGYLIETVQLLMQI